MSYEIKWTPLAKDNYFETVSYIYDAWGEISAEKFTDDLEASLKNLERFHFIGKPHAFIAICSRVGIRQAPKLVLYFI